MRPKTKRKLAEVEARNRLDNLVYQTEKVVKENRDKLAEAGRESGRRRDCRSAHRAERQRCRQDERRRR